MRRVVVTGLGAVTPIGNDVPTFWDSIKNGVCGIDTVTGFDITDYKTVGEDCSYIVLNMRHSQGKCAYIYVK